MTHRVFTLEGSTDTFEVTDRPHSAPTWRWRALPEGLNISHMTVVRAHQVQAGDLVVAEFTDTTPVRQAEHLIEPYTAAPHSLGHCGCEGCEACDDLNDEQTHAERYLCLAPSDAIEPCAIEFRNAPVAVIPAAVAIEYPPMDSVPPMADLFTVEGTDCGPYEASPAPRGWGPYDKISVTRETAEQLTTDLNTRHAVRGLTAMWKADWLVFSWDKTYRHKPGPNRLIVEPDATGRYSIGNLWRWDTRETPEPAGD
ncbi:hypothetical protein [Streptomyces sp. NPDC097610]|uniref:hypothetical protein n=1 Tax=Streptomyces sp. NPDC097610 TaxID=3157227 RepID=UPI00332FE291